MTRAFCGGDSLANSVVSSTALVQLGVGHRVHDRRRSSVVRHVQADIPADLAGHQLVVAGQDLHRDAVRAAGRRWPGRPISLGGSRKAM